MNQNLLVTQDREPFVDERNQKMNKENFPLEKFWRNDLGEEIHDGNIRKCKLKAIWSSEEKLFRKFFLFESQANNLNLNLGLTTFIY